MKNIPIFILTFLLFISSCQGPLVIFHWQKDGVRFVIKKKTNGDNAYGYPNHSLLSRVICFDELCKNKAVWMDKQKNMTYKVKNKHPKHHHKTPPIPAITAPDTVRPSSKIALTNSLPIEQEKSIPIEMEKPIENTEKLPPVPLNKVFVFKNLNFETGTSVVSRSSKSSLDTVIQMMQENPNLKVQISGHTDNVGTENGNMKLSWDRAECVSIHLVKTGILKNRIKILGFGSTKPLSSFDRKVNRRVEFYFTEN